MSGLSVPGSGGRTIITADRTYYVRKDGSDANTGLVDNAGGAKLTIMGAMNAAAKIDFNGFTVTVQMRDGTYDERVIVPLMVGQASPLHLQLAGNSTTPTNTIVRNTGAYQPCIEANGATITVKNFRVTAPNNGYGLNAAEGGVISLAGGMDFGDCTGQYHMYANNSGTINCFQPYTISGPASAHWAAALCGHIYATTTVNAQSLAVAFSFGFAVAIISGVMQVNGCTFQNVASVTGARYATQKNGVIETFGAGASYLPGSAVGTSATGGQYG